MLSRALVLRSSPKRPLHQLESHQLTASIAGVSTSTASVAGMRGTRINTRIVPSTNPTPKTRTAYTSPAAAARISASSICTRNRPGGIRANTERLSQ